VRDRRSRNVRNALVIFLMGLAVECAALVTWR
jgi:hypothetical protein